MSFDPDSDLRGLAEAQRPTPLELSAMQQRLARDLDPGPRRARWPWMLALATAIAVLGIVGLSLAPRIEIIDLSGNGRPINTGVIADVSGFGHAEVRGDRTEVTWTEGRLNLEVDRADGRQVEIYTEEAVVRVVGTGLTVDRGPFGTSVMVSHGRVRVQCLAGDAVEHEVGAGERRDCLKDAGAGLGQLLALERQGAGPEARLQVVDAALAHPVGLSATRSALLDRKLEILVALGRAEAAIRAAADLEPTAAIAWWRAGADRGMADGGCPDAMPWLDALAEAADPLGSLILVQCLAASDPVRARGILDALASRDLSPAESARVDQWRGALP